MEIKEKMTGRYFFNIKGKALKKYTGNNAVIVIPTGITAIESAAFVDCKNAETIIIPESVIYIGSGAFSGCTGLKKVVIHNGVKCIESYAFANCSNLKSVSIPESVECISINAFKNCHFDYVDFGQRKNFSGILDDTLKSMLPKSTGRVWFNKILNMLMNR